MSKKHSYGLDWIDEDALYGVTKLSFSKVFSPVKRKPLPPDPFTLVAQAVLAGEAVSHEKPLFAEVKNRFNTIKASDEKNIWDNLDSLARASDAVAYLFQIVPKTPEQYNRPWKVSGRSEKSIVRVCDGVTAYALVFERPTALHEIYMALPRIFSDITGQGVKLDEKEMEDLFTTSLPI